MFTLIIVALTAALIGAGVATALFIKKVTQINEAHEAELNKEWHEGFRGGWDSGVIHGKHQGRIEYIREKAKQQD